MMRSGLLLVACFALPLAACVAPQGRLDAACSGVPGDPGVVGAPSAPVVATHGPGAPNAAIEVAATHRPADAEVIPSLYVFDERARYVHASSPLYAHVSGPVFARLEQESYWGEVVNGGYYLVPELDPCNAASMFAGGFDFRAPTGGLLFVQYIAADCRDCAETTAAIQQAIDAAPTLPVRWVRVAVPRTIGKPARD